MFRAQTVLCGLNVVRPALLVALGCGDLSSLSSTQQIELCKCLSAAASLALAAVVAAVQPGAHRSPSGQGQSGVCRSECDS